MSGYYKKIRNVEKNEKLSKQQKEEKIRKYKAKVNEYAQKGVVYYNLKN